MINITNNPAQKLALGVASATIQFTTDATPAVQTTATIAGGQGYLAVASSTGIVAGDFLAAETGNSAGTGPWVSTVLGAITATNVNTSVPSSRVALTNGVITRFERIETRYRAKKLTLTNNLNSDAYVWDNTLNDNQALKTSGGTTTTISNGFLNRPNCVCIHPNLLPASASFTLVCEYDYRT